MAFASLDLLAVVKASFCSTHLRGLHRLTIQTPRRRMFVPFLAFSDAGAYRIMHADPHTGAFPGSEVMIDTLPLGEIDRQHAPLDAPFRHIKDGIEHRAHTQGARSSTTFGGGNQIFDPLPFLVSEVAWIYFFVHLHILHNLRRLFRQALTGVQPYVEEGLLIPFYVGGQAVGTIWVMAHDQSRRFDAEDLRVMTNLAHFAAAAYAARTRQVAVRADVNAALATEESLRGKLQSCTEALVRHLDAAVARIWVITQDK